MFGSEIKIGLTELIFIAIGLIAVALFVDPANVAAKLKATVAQFVPWLRNREVVVEEVDDFLDLHARLTALSIEQEGAYNEPLAEMYSIYLKREAPPAAAEPGSAKKGGAKTS